MNKIKEIAEYCRRNIVDFEDKAQLALNYIGRHEPVPCGFFDEIVESVEEWCEDNEVALDFFEDWDEIVEDVIYGDVV